jgi:flagellar biosynthesis/type III secretory pathway chaperone
MGDSPGRTSIGAVLADLETLLAQEREALKRLDTDSIESITERKARLERELRELSEACDLTGAEREVAGRIREAAQANQLLLVHARACVRNALAIATGQAASQYTAGGAEAAVPSALRVNVKG